MTSRRVLILDDNLVDQKIFSRAIRKSERDLSYSLFDDPQDFIDSLTRGSASEAHSIFIDIKMPNMDGFEVVEMMEELFPDIVSDVRVFICSSSVNPEDIRRANGHPMIDGFIEKPVKRSDIDAIFDREPIH